MSPRCPSAGHRCHSATSCRSRSQYAVKSRRNRCCSWHRPVHIPPTAQFEVVAQETPVGTGKFRAAPPHRLHRPELLAVPKSEVERRYRGLEPSWTCVGTDSPPDSYAFVAQETLIGLQESCLPTVCGDGVQRPISSLSTTPRTLIEPTSPNAACTFGTRVRPVPVSRQDTLLNGGVRRPFAAALPQCLH